MKPPHASQVYADQILKAIPRLLANLDRDPFSPTYGCFDREYWAWATKEFSNIDLQRGVYALAFVWKHPFSGNVYHQKKKVLQWIIGGLRYWCSVQHPDGSFDHLYPNEHSYVGAAFPLFEICQTYALVCDHLDPVFREKLIFHMRKAGGFLLLHEEQHGFISNHRAGTACALHHLSVITNEASFARKASELIAGIRSRQSPEGWFYEYSGADPGYQTLDTHYLAHYFSMTKDPGVLSMLHTSISFISHFVHPDGTIGGEYGSRLTEIYFPAGFEIMSSHDSMAHSIAACMRTSIDSGACVTLNTLDVRNFVPFLSSYCAALLHVLDGSKTVAYTKLLFQKLPFQKLPFQIPGTAYFPEAGMAIISTKKAYSVLGIGKGIVRVYRDGSLVFNHCGYLGKLANNTLISTQMTGSATNLETNLETNLAINLTNSNPHLNRSINSNRSLLSNTISCVLRFYKVPSRIMTKTRFALFRIFNFTFGRFYTINNFIRQQVIVRFFIAPKPRPLLSMKRLMQISDDEIVITDEIEAGRYTFKSLKAGERFTTIFMASAKYYQPADLIESLQSKDLALRLNKEKRITIEYRVSLK